MRAKVIVSWSSGKDSAWMLAVLRQSEDVEVVGLLTTFDRDAGRVSMHDVRKELVHAQARSVGVPLLQVMLPAACSNADYEAAMGEVLTQARGRGVTAVAFGDLFLEDIRRYREEKLAQVGMDALFPLWGTGTRTLAQQMLDAGVQAYVTSVDTEQLGVEFAARRFDRAFLDELPQTVDPCGERGEFHTFTTNGPAFSEPIAVVVGDVVQRGRFAYADVRPVTESSSS